MTKVKQTPKNSRQIHESLKTAPYAIALRGGGHGVKRPVSEALPEDNLGPVLLVFLLADPSVAEGGQVGQHRPPAPHGEVPVLGGGDADALPHVGGNQPSDFTPEPLGEARQQRVPACVKGGWEN